MFVLGDVESCSGYLAGGFVEPCELIQQGSLACVGKPHKLYPFDRILLEVVFQSFDTRAICAPTNHDLHLLNLFSQLGPLALFPVLDKLEHHLLNLLHNQMLVQVLLVNDIELVDHDTELHVRFEQPVEDVLFEGTCNVQDVDEIQEGGRQGVMLLEHLRHEDVLGVVGL